MRLRSALLALATLPALAACDTYYGDRGYGYGYGGVSLGFGRGYYDPWYDPYWDHYASNPYWGWYNGFYYPGSGIFIYDRWRRPFRWSDRHRRFWMDRRSHWERRGDWNGRREWRDNWRDFAGDGDGVRGLRRDSRMGDASLRGRRIEGDSFRGRRMDDGASRSAQGGFSPRSAGPAIRRSEAPSRASGRPAARGQRPTQQE